MSKLEDDLSRYFTALDRLGPGDAEPAYPLAASPRRPNRRRVALLVAAVVVLVAAIAGAVVVRDRSESSYAAIPEGWQTVTFSSVQFGVPGDWPVYTDDRCYDYSRDGVYAEGRWPSSSCLTSSVTSFLVSTLATVDWNESDGYPFGPGTPDTTLNGLRVQIQRREYEDSVFATLDVALMDEAVFISMGFPNDAGHRALADQILQTIGPARHPLPRPTLQPRPPKPTTTTTRYAPEVAAFCEAVVRLQDAGLPSGPDGGENPDKLPYYEGIRDAGPAEIRPPLETIIAWIEEGAPIPKSEDVLAAEQQAMTDWISRCNDVGP